jgi:cytochrome c oxidase subunit III
MAHSQAHDKYYVPHGTSWWPIIGSVGLTSLVVGFSIVLNSGAGLGKILMVLGVLVTLFMLFGWFGMVIRESEQNFYNKQVDVSYRWSMSWFIFSEVMFFAAFFGALFYARVYSLPWLGGEGDGVMTNQLLWPEFEAMWPSSGPGEVGGDFQIMGAWGIPAWNTAILLTSGVTVTWAHHGLWARCSSRCRPMSTSMPTTI